MSHIRLFNHYMPTPLLLLGCIEWLAMLFAVPIAVQLRFDAPMQWLDPSILELNAGHPVVKKLQGLSEDDKFADWSALLYDQALLAEGTLPGDPAAFSKRLTSLMAGN